MQLDLASFCRHRAVRMKIDDLRPDRYVQRRHRLVTDDDLRIQRQRARNAQPLTMAARELVRIVLHVRGPQADFEEQLRNLLAQRRRAQLPPQVVQPSNSISGEANASTIAGPSSISVGVLPLVWIAYARSMSLSS